MKNTLSLFLIAIMASILAGCPATKEVKKEEPLPLPPVIKKSTDPDIILKVASINLAKLGKRIERNDIDETNVILKKEQIDIITLQGVSRYPDVATRIDVVNELTSRAEMRKAFGETITLSGRQTGNAVLSIYPITSNENSHYEGLRSTNFEAALQAVVDCGIRDIVVVSTGLPETLTDDDKRTIANKLSSFGILYLDTPMIITGNLSAPDVLRLTSQYEALKPNANNDAPRMWFSNGGAVKLLSQKIETTALGSMTIAEFGLFRKPQP